MKAITIRNIPPRIARRISQRAARDHTSLNKTVINMLGESAPPAAGAQERAAQRPRIDVSMLVGSWTEEEADEFNAYLKETRRVDPEMWK
jgi:plasmid stability protein